MVLQQKRVLQLLHLAIVFRILQDRLKPAKTTQKTSGHDKVKDSAAFVARSVNGVRRHRAAGIAATVTTRGTFSKAAARRGIRLRPAGSAPVAATKWRWTICLSCQRWSQHEKWYED